jgi:starch-binding outer membrane protein, SusD/RagB family
MTMINTHMRVAMRRRGVRIASTLAVVLATGACADLDILNTNAPTVETLTGNPTREVLARAATGIFSQTFNDIGTEIQFYALYGREGYNLLGNDPRETNEQIRGPQDPTGRNSGIWTGPYSAIRTINTYLAALPNSTGLTEQELRASAGFAKTMKAWHIHRLAIRTGEYGIPLDVDRSINDEPAPFVSFAAAMEAASNLMNEALGDLQAGGGAFPFTMAPGYVGFSTPATFAEFNRALAAKILVHRATFVNCGTCWAEAATALNASFVTDAGLPGSLDEGVYYGYSAAAGEPANPVSEPIANNRLWVHPSIMAGAQTQPGGAPDARLTEKVLDSGRSHSEDDLTGTHKPVLYNSASNPTVADPGADIPWINNEELLLLRAEIRWNTGNPAGAILDIDRVRLHAGGLAPSGLTVASSDEAFIDELLYNRLYSLMWSQGTRWLDARRYDRLDELPRDRVGDAVYDGMLVPAAECSARGLAAPCTPL